jgi:peptide/nickel transport system ATP-binding protein
MSAAERPALRVADLRVSYRVRGRELEVLRGVSLEIARGEAYGLVGESGCGKSTTAYAAVRHLPSNGRVTSGRVEIAGSDVLGMSERDLRRIRRSDVSMVYQDPSSSLNPVVRIGPQVVECFTVLGLGEREARSRAIAALERVHIADATRVMGRYPHELSGGMQQRVVIAMALACDPSLLVLDEPTTSLDATVEAEVLDLVRVLRNEVDAAILLIAHNLGVVRSVCERVGVMYAGWIVEQGPVADVFDRPRHPYTTALLDCLPRLGAHKHRRLLTTIPGSLPKPGTNLEGCVYVDRCPIEADVCRQVTPPTVTVGVGRETRCHRSGEVESSRAVASTATMTAPPPGRVVVKMQSVAKTFGSRGHRVPALVGVDLGIREGETLGLVGESGSGKTTLAKVLLGIFQSDEGSTLTLDAHDLAADVASRPTEDRRALQIVFQNPDSALNRNWSVRGILRRAVTKLTALKGDEADARVDALAGALRLSAEHLAMRPRQLSGGLKQRVAIARAFAGDPRIVVCDEPTSALDVSVQAAILNVLAELQGRARTSYLFISHDLAVVRYLSDRIAVMYLGRIVELGPAEAVFSGPHHPYTEALLSAVPDVDGGSGRRIQVTGELPSHSAPPPGCAFHPRCHRFIPGTCDVLEPPARAVGDAHVVHCHVEPEALGRRGPQLVPSGAKG